MPSLIPQQSAAYQAIAELAPESLAFVALLRSHDSNPRLEGVGLQTRLLTTGAPRIQVEVRGIYRVRPNQQCPAPDVAIIAELQGGAVLRLLPPVEVASLS